MSLHEHAIVYLPIEGHLEYFQVQLHSTWRDSQIIFLYLFLSSYVKMLHQCMWKVKFLPLRPWKLYQKWIVWVFYFFANLEVGKQSLSFLGFLPPPTRTSLGALWIVHHVSCWYRMILLSQILMVVKNMSSLIHRRIYWTQCCTETEALEVDKSNIFHSCFHGA